MSRFWLLAATLVFAGCAVLFGLLAEGVIASPYGGSDPLRLHGAAFGAALTALTFALAARRAKPPRRHAGRIGR